jgi:hypothetical protein
VNLHITPNNNLVEAAAIKYAEELPVHCMYRVKFIHIHINGCIILTAEQRYDTIEFPEEEKKF